MMTREQEQVLEQAVIRGLLKDRREGYEAGCAALRRQLHELQEEEKAKQEAAARAETQALACNELKLF